MVKIKAINTDFLRLFLDKPLSVKEVAEKANLRYPAVTRRIYRLEAAKCIARVGVNTRPVVYAITDFGKEALKVV